MRILETKQSKCKEVDQNNVYIITAAWYACNQILSTVNLSKTISKQSMQISYPPSCGKPTVWIPSTTKLYVYALKWFGM